MIFDKRQSKKLRKNGRFNSQCWSNQRSAWKRKKLDSYFTAHTTTNSKRIKDLNARAKAIKPLGNIGVNFHDFKLGKDFLAITPKHKKLKKKKDKLLFLLFSP